MAWNKHSSSLSDSFTSNSSTLSGSSNSSLSSENIVEKYRDLCKNLNSYAKEGTSSIEKTQRRASNLMDDLENSIISSTYTKKEINQMTQSFEQYVYKNLEKADKKYYDSKEFGKTTDMEKTGMEKHSYLGGKGRITETRKIDSSGIEEEIKNLDKKTMQTTRYLDDSKVDYKSKSKREELEESRNAKAMLGNKPKSYSI